MDEESMDVSEVDQNDEDSDSESQKIVKKRKRSSSPQLNASLTNNDDDSTCTICFENFQSSGEHKIVSLKCGHIFGDSCIRRWLRGSSDQKFCPQCKLKATPRDIRHIYATKVRIRDNSREEKLMTELTSIKQSYEDLKRENCYNLMMISNHKAKINELQKENERLQNALRNNNSDSMFAGIRTIKECRIYLEKNLDFKENLDSRLVKYLNRPKKVLISQKTSGLFSGFGVKFIDFQTYRAERLINTSSKIVNEFCTDVNQTLLIATSREPVCKMFSIKSSENLSTFRSPNSIAFWSCSFDNERSNCILLGGQNGNLFKFDSRNPNEVVNEIANDQFKSPLKNIVAIKGNKYFPRGGYFIVYTRGLSFYEDYSSRSTTLMNEAIATLTYDEMTEMVLITKSPTRTENVFKPTTHYLMRLLRDTDDPDSLPFLQEVHHFEGTSSSMPIFSRPTQIKVADGAIVVSYLQDTKMLQTRSHNQNTIYSETALSDHVYDVCPIYEDNSCNTQMFGAVSNSKFRLYKLNLNY